jgi:type II secretory pathway predicted ATPase ExeA
MQPIDSTFSVPPFPAFPSVTRYVPLGSVQEALDRICRSIDAREGVALVLGPPGTGKSLVCGLLADRYRPSHDVVMLGDTPLKDGTAFQRHLLHRLGADFDRLDTSDLHLALIDRVCDADSPQGGLLILVDEAQSLSAEVIESIRMATNIMRDGQPRVFAVLGGNVTLEETLVSTSLEAFTQRVSTRCYLHAMNVEETRCYIRETIRQCGADPDHTITPEAIAAVHHACMGVPRLVNQIMTEAIDCAEEASQTLMDEQVIERAWTRLQQLPSPMIDQPKILSDASTVEFGELAEVPSDFEFSVEDNCDSAETDDSLTDLEIVEATGFDSCEVESLPHQSCSMESSPTRATPQRDPQNAQPTAPISPKDLFGEFDVEEDLTIGSALKATERKTYSDETSIESVLHQEIIGLSAMAAGGLALYGETCEEQQSTYHPNRSRTGQTGDNSFAAELTDNTSAAEFTDNTSAAELTDNTSAAELTDGGSAAAPEAAPEEFIDESIETKAIPAAATIEQQFAPYQDSEPTICQLTAETSVGVDDSVDSERTSIGDDDSDLLVIEDDVQLARTDEVTRIDAREQTISVDFQAMLSRMRSNA